MEKVIKVPSKKKKRKEKTLQCETNKYYSYIQWIALTAEPDLDGIFPAYNL